MLQFRYNHGQPRTIVNGFRKPVGFRNFAPLVNGFRNTDTLVNDSKSPDTLVNAFRNLATADSVTLPKTDSGILAR